jgi:hypothetical protein
MQGDAIGFQGVEQGMVVSIGPDERQFWKLVTQQTGSDIQYMQLT